VTWIYRYEELVTWHKCLVVETECGELSLVVHLKCPRLSDRNTISHLPVRDASDLDKNMRMGVDQLELLHFHFKGNAPRSIVNIPDPVVALGSRAAKQDAKECD